MGGSFKDIQTTARLSRLLTELGFSPQLLFSTGSSESFVQESPVVAIPKTLSVDELRLNVRSDVQLGKSWEEIELKLLEIYDSTDNPDDFSGLLELAIAFNQYHRIGGLLSSIPATAAWRAYVAVMQPVREAIGSLLLKDLCAKNDIPRGIWSMLLQGAISDDLNASEVIALWIWGIENREVDLVLALISEFFERFKADQIHGLIVDVMRSRQLAMRSAEMAYVAGVPSLSRQLLESGWLPRDFDEDAAAFLFNARHALDTNVVRALKDVAINQNLLVDAKFELPRMANTIPTGFGRYQRDAQCRRIRTFIGRQKTMTVEQLSTLADLEACEGRLGGAIAAWLQIGECFHYRNNDLEDISLQTKNDERLLKVSRICRGILSSRNEFWSDRSEYGGSGNLGIDDDCVEYPRPASECGARIYQYIEGFFQKHGANLVAPNDTMNPGRNDELEIAHIYVQSEVIDRYLKNPLPGFWLTLSDLKGSSRCNGQPECIEGNVQVPQFLERISSSAWGQLLAVLVQKFHEVTEQDTRYQTDEQLALKAVLTVAVLYKNPLEFLDGVRAVLPVWMIWRLEAFLIAEEMHRAMVEKT